MKNVVQMTTNPIDKCGSPGSLCVTEVKALKPLVGALSNPKTDITIYLPINQRTQIADFMGLFFSFLNFLTITYPHKPFLFRLNFDFYILIISLFALR